MFGIPESEMQEAEKLCDTFDRLRKLAVEHRITATIQTVHVQPAPDVTDFILTVPRISSNEGVYEFLAALILQEHPTAIYQDEDGQRVRFNFTLPIGYSSLRDGVTQQVDPNAPKVAFDIESDVLGKESGIASWIVPPPIAGHCKECGSEIPFTEHFFHLDAVKRMMTPVGKGREYEVELPSGVKVMLHVPTRARVEQIINGFGHDFEPCADGDVIILGGRDYRVTRPHHDRIPDELEYMYPHRLERLNFPGMGGVWPMGDSAAPTPERAAAKRRQSDVHVNGRPKKSWQR